MPDHLTDPGPEEQAYIRTYLVGSLGAADKLSSVCPFASTLTAFSLTLGGFVLCPLPCKRWGCKKCGPRKARKMAYRVEAAVPNKLITLTVRPEPMETPRQAYDRSRRNLSELAKKLRKSLGEFEYLRILEVTKKGMPHYHLMARCPYIPQRDLSDAWNKLTNAPIVDIRKIQKTDNVFRYMIKYLCKQSYIPWTDRRCSWTRKFFNDDDQFEPLNLQLVQAERNKEDPVQIAREWFPGREFTEVSPTCFLVVPSEQDQEASIILIKDKIHHDGFNTPREDF